MNTSVPYTVYLDELGYLQIVTWVDGKRTSLYKLPKDQCSYFGRCGAFGYCDATVNLYEAYDFECSCLPVYEPKLKQQWYNLRDTSSGCVKKRPTLSMCGNGEGFVVMERIEVPDTSSSNANLEMNLGLEGCRVKCLKDRSCNGFAIGGIGECIAWHGNMTDTKKFPAGRLKFHVRVDHIELAQHSNKSKSLLHTKGFVMVVTSVSGTLVFVISCVCWLISNKSRGFSIHVSTKQNVELPVFDMDILEEATNKFSARNVMGEGGFGTVYKGQLSSGKDIAVKHLSIVSRQGLNEFMNEAWKFWMEGRAEELLDPLVEGSVPVDEVIRGIHVGLLCVQKCPEDRPIMSSALWMLVTHAAVLPPPEQPGFYMERSSYETHPPQDGETFSINDVSIMNLAPR